MNKIAIFSVPRSGSTWLGQIFNSHPCVVYRFQPNLAYTFPLTLSDHSTRQEIQEFYQALLTTDDPFTTAKISISGRLNPSYPKQDPSTLVLKETHHLYIIDNLLRNSDTKVIALVRSPFATLYSWINTPKEFHADWDLREEWKFGAKKNEGDPRNFFGYNKWKEAMHLFLDLREKHDGQFMVLSYEQLLSATVPCINEVFEFCGLDLPEQTLEFIASSESKHEEDVYSVFRIKRKDDAWMKGLPSFVVDAIKDDPEFQQLNSLFKWV